MIGENGIETCILSCKKRIGEGGERGVHVWERMYTRGGFMSMYGKTNTVL